MTPRALAAPLAVLFFVLVGCDLAEEPFRPQVVVEGMLVAGEPLPSIRLSQTAPLGATYSFEAFAVGGAVVEVELLGTDGGTVARNRYIESVGQPGVYLPLNARTVLPGRRYRFVADVPEALGLVAPGARVRAETLVPDTFRVVTPPPASVRYNPFGVPPQLTVTPSAYPGRQAIYLFSIQALDPGAGLTPTYAAFLNEEQAERLIEGTSPLLNEENYTRNPDGTLTLEIPWLAIVYYGPNRFTASALDDGLYDYLRSRDTQFSGGTLSPGEIPEVLSNVENGTGVFGSVAQRAVEVTIERAGG